MLSNQDGQYGVVGVSADWPTPHAVSILGRPLNLHIHFALDACWVCLDTKNPFGTKIKLPMLWVLLLMLHVSTESTSSCEERHGEIKPTCAYRSNTLTHKGSTKTQYGSRLVDVALFSSFPRLLRTL